MPAMFAKESVQSFWKAATCSKPLFILSLIVRFFKVAKFFLELRRHFAETRDIDEKRRKSWRSVLTLSARVNFLEHCLIAGFLLAQVITSSRPGRNDPRVPSNQRSF